MLPLFLAPPNDLARLAYERFALREAPCDTVHGLIVNIEQGISAVSVDHGVLPLQYRAQARVAVLHRYYRREFVGASCCVLRL
jgi:hypothetical protein